MLMFISGFLCSSSYGVALIGYLNVLLDPSYWDVTLTVILLSL